SNLPLVSMADMKADRFDLTYCEDAVDNETACNSQDAVAEITITPSFNNLTDEFATVYTTRLRGGIERFGVYPLDEQFGYSESQLFTKRDGGTLEVKDAASAVAGAKIMVPADPYPDYPEQFTPETAIAFNDPADTFECMWEDTMLSISHRTNPPDMGDVTALGPAVHFGPYRTLFNRDVTITLPYDAASAGNSPVGVYVYNHLTREWQEIDTAFSGNGSVSFATTYLGLFRAGPAGGETAVTPASFSAKSIGWNVVLKWSTSGEDATQGFNLYRSSSTAGPFEKVNTVLIPARGRADGDAHYRFVDRWVGLGTQHYYFLEEIGRTGKAVRHGFVAASQGFWAGLFQ
ncbi:MAG: hypothetical protein MI741_10465, partial [Rhodospirillales bacterium]|nr:hypothetical protein [Rhodospirillales bacterium]